MEWGIRRGRDGGGGSAGGLISLETRRVLTGMLMRSQMYRQQYWSMVLNWGLLVCAGLLMGGWLYWRYQSRPSAEELRRRELRKQQYLLERIRAYKEEELHRHQYMITGLPFWDVKDMAEALPTLPRPVGLL